MNGIKLHFNHPVSEFIMFLTEPKQTYKEYRKYGNYTINYIEPNYKMYNPDIKHNSKRKNAKKCRSKKKRPGLGL